MLILTIVIKFKVVACYNTRHTWQRQEGCSRSGNQSLHGYNHVQCFVIVLIDLDLKLLYDPFNLHQDLLIILWIMKCVESVKQLLYVCSISKQWMIYETKASCSHHKLLGQELFIPESTCWLTSESGLSWCHHTKHHETVN